MKNKIIILLTLIIAILVTIIVTRSFFDVEKNQTEIKCQQSYQRAAEEEAKEDAARMEDAVRNLNKTR